MSGHREHLIELARADQRRSVEEANVTYRALEARRAGASWREIGAELGMTKQAAQKRYDRKLF